MSATTRTGKHVAERRRIRLPSMETLGFIDDDAAQDTWTSATVETEDELLTTEPTSTIAEDEILGAWAPSDSVTKLKTARVRWSAVISILLMLIAGAGITLFILQQPEASATAVVEQVDLDAGAVAGQSSVLAGAIQTQDETPALVRDLDSAARALFNSSALLPASLTSKRTAAADAATDALEATRTMADAISFRSAVAPLLLVPEFPTDPSLVQIEDVAHQFSEWQAGLSGAIGSLPEDIMPSARAELVTASASLDSVRTQYLDALRAGDQSAAAQALSTLDEHINSASDALALEYEEVAFRAVEFLLRAEQAATSALG